MNNTTPFAAYLDAEIGRGSSLVKYLSNALGKKVHKQHLTRVKQRAVRFPSDWMVHVVKWSRNDIKLADLAKYAEKV